MATRKPTLDLLAGARVHREVADAAPAARGDQVAPAALTPSEVLRRARANVEHIGRNGDILVEGELFDVRPLRNGHKTFELKDPSAALPCILFASQARRVLFELKQGLKVVVAGQPSVSDWAKVQLKVTRVEPVGVGRLDLAFRQLKERLEREGLFSPARKRKPPFLPRAVGVVTSTHGAALHDVVEVLRQRMPAMRIVVSATRVQGAAAAQEIAAALGRLDAARCCEVILLVRGGGSLEDLWAFNTEPVARAIAACATPVITGVGHETDVTIADLVADVRAATPSNAAEQAVPRRLELDARIDRSTRRLVSALRQRVAEARAQVTRFQQRLEDPRHTLARRRRVLVELAARLDRALAARRTRAQQRVRALDERLRREALDRRVMQQRTQVATLAARLEPAALVRRAQAASALELLAARLASVSPLAVLARGYAIARRVDDGHVVRGPEDAPAGTRLELKVERGSLRVTTDDS